jgi:hypothetical protein
MKNNSVSKEYKAALETVLANLTTEQQELVIGDPDSEASVAVAIAAERLVDARAAAKGKGAGSERQLVSALNPRTRCEGGD